MHAVWYTQESGEGHLFHGAINGDKPIVPKPLGKGMHPSVLIRGKQRFMVWQAFSGDGLAIRARVSQDNGKSWLPEVELAHSTEVADYPVLLEHPTGVYVFWFVNGRVRLLPLKSAY